MVGGHVTSYVCEVCARSRAAPRRPAAAIETAARSRAGDSTPVRLRPAAPAGRRPERPGGQTNRARPSPTARRSGPRPRTTPASVCLRGARAGAAGRARTGRHRRSPAAACSTSDSASISAGADRLGRVVLLSRGHTRARTESVLTGCASGTLLGSVPARGSPEKWRGHWFWRPSRSRGAAVLVGVTGRAPPIGARSLVTGPGAGEWMSPWLSRGQRLDERVSERRCSPPRFVG